MPLQHSNSNADEFISDTLTSLNDTVVLDTMDSESATIAHITGTWVATLSFQGTLDGTNWVSIYGRPLSATPLPVQTTAANGAWRFATAGLRQIRVIATAYTSGTATVVLRNSDGATINSEITPMMITTANQAAAGLYATNTAYGYVRCAVEPSALFNDGFEGASVDTINRWETPTQTGGGSVSLILGSMLTSITTSANSKAALSSRAKFGSNTGLGLLAWGCLVQYETTMSQNAHRFWGIGVVDGGWSVSSPLKDGVGFEITTAGVVRACVYAQSTLVYSQVLTTQTDGAFHPYTIVYRNDVVFWYVDSTEIPVASLRWNWPGFPGVPFLSDVTTFPIRFHAISGASAPTGTGASVTVSALGLGDTSHSNNMLSDGTFPWRKARISPGGALYTTEMGSDLSYNLMQQAIATANLKSMVSITNISSTYNIRVNSIYLINVQTTAVTGVACRFNLFRLSGSNPSGGTDISSTAIVPLDTAGPTASTHVLARTGATSVGTEGTIPLNSVVWYTEERVVGTISVVMHEQIAQMATPLWGKQPGATGILLRATEGLTVKCVTNTTTGSFDVLMVFSLEPVS